MSHFRANLKDLYLFVSIPVHIFPPLSRALEIAIYAVHNYKDSFCQLHLTVLVFKFPNTIKSRSQIGQTYRAEGSKL